MMIVRLSGHPLVQDSLTNNEIAQTSPVEYITDEDWTTLVKHWSDPKYQVGYMYLIRPHIELVFMYVPYKCIFF